MRSWLIIGAPLHASLSDCSPSLADWSSGMREEGGGYALVSAVKRTPAKRRSILSEPSNSARASQRFTCKVSRVDAFVGPLSPNVARLFATAKRS
jgi:hypothetical protein